MGLRINTNLASLYAHLNLQTNDDALNASLQRLSSGYRINRSADDAAGLAIATRMQAEIGGLDQAKQDAQDGISLLQTTEGALSQTQALLQRMRELAVEAANDTLSSPDRTNISLELNALSSEIDRIASSTDFNAKKLLDGSLATTGLTFQLGAYDGLNLNVTIPTATAAALTVNAGNLNISSSGAASTTIANIDSAITQISTQRASLGAAVNRIQSTYASLGVQGENLNASRSRIVDLDMASEVVELSRHQILEQSSTAMLQQANQAPQAILQLLHS
jgi:flagellin